VTLAPLLAEAPPLTRELEAMLEPMERGGDGEPVR
jgi:hypothetical protein